MANSEKELSGVFQMGIYDGDYSVRAILEDCQPKSRDFARSSIRSSKVVEGVDLDLLNERLSAIPVSEIRQRRARMNIFYQEILVSADPDRGISFTSLLMILAHYNVINDTKSLR
jgi:voltage-dependent calcium channel